MRTVRPTGSFRRRAGALLAATAVSTLSACASMEPSMRDMSVAYSVVVERYVNDNNLLNIVRASRAMPLSFMDLPNVIGSGSVTGNAGLMADFYVPDPLAMPLQNRVSPTLSLGVSRTFNFTQASLDNASFMKGFLGQLSPEVLNFMINSNVPEELLLKMLVKSIKLVGRDGLERTVRNEPLREDHAEFQQLVETLMDVGLSSEVTAKIEPFGPVMTRDEVVRRMEAFTMMAKDGFVLVPVPSPEGEKYQVARPATVARICMDRAEFESRVKEAYPDSMFCAAKAGTSRLPRTEPGAAPPVLQSGHELGLPPNLVSAIEVSIRSPREVFDYLGQVVAAQLGPRRYVVTVRDARPDAPPTGESRVSLLRVLKDEKPTGSTPSAAEIAYQGSDYAIPGDDAGYSSLTLDVVSRLLTLSKIPGSIPASPAVLVR